MDSKARLKEKVSWCKSDIEFYRESIEQTKALIKKAKEPEHIRLLKENIVAYKREIRKARQELKRLL